MGRGGSVGADFYAEDFLKAGSSQRDAREYVGLLGRHQVQQGQGYAVVGEKLRVHWRTVQNWVRRYKARGVAGLENQAGQGKKPSLPKALEQDFKTRLLEAQASKGGGRLTAQDAQALLKHWFSISYSRASIDRLLHRAGLSWITGRALHPKANPAVQAAFKKTSSRRLSKPSPAG